MTTPDDDAFVLPSAAPDPNRTLFVSAKFGTTVNRGNYGSDRYDFIVSDYYPSGTSIAEIAADLFAQARAAIRTQDAYDQRIRKLTSKLEHASHTVLEWDARYETYQDDESIEEADRGRLLTIVTRRRKDQAEQDERARQKREQQELTIQNIIAVTRTWLESNPIPSEEELWSDLDRNNTPAYYGRLKGEWASIRGWHEIPYDAQTALIKAPADAIVAASVADIMDGNLPTRPPRPEPAAPSTFTGVDFSDFPDIPDDEEDD